MIESSSLVRSLIVEVLGEGRGVAALASLNMVSEGHLDSFSIIELAARIEDRMNITIPAERLTAEDFASVANLTRLCVELGAKHHDA